MASCTLSDLMAIVFLLISVMSPSRAPNKSELSSGSKSGPSVTVVDPPALSLDPPTLAVDPPGPALFVLAAVCIFLVGGFAEIVGAIPTSRSRVFYVAFLSFFIAVFLVSSLLIIFSTLAMISSGDAISRSIDSSPVLPKPMWPSFP